jgi:endonuclease III
MENIDKMFNILDKEVIHFKVPVVDLIKVQTGSVYKILIATILSARTKDETTADASRRLFSIAPDLKSLNELSIEDIESLIYPVGFYKNKALYLKKLPGVLKSKFNNIIPDTIDDLVKLPGVGRKTANLVLAQGFEKPAICVDIHVHRIFNRLGYLETKTPFETEMALREKLNKKYWIKTNTYFVMLGQHICRPVSPKCTRCPISNCCKKIIKKGLSQK